MNIYRYGNEESDNVLIQMVDDHDLDVIEKEIEYIRELSASDDFYLIAIKVDNWNNDLSPWKAPAVFGKEELGGQADVTLSKVLEYIEKEIFTRKNHTDISLYIGGYSLAGLFALWAGYQTDRFDAIVAASPSVWYPGWTEYADTHAFRAGRAYLSLGDREAKTRHPLMRTVEEALRSQYDVLVRQGVPAAMEFNPGNHFTDAAPRTARGFAWCIGA